MDTFQSLLQAVIQFEPNAEKVLGDFVEESGKDREKFDEVLLPLLEVTKVTLHGLASIEEYLHNDNIEVLHHILRNGWNKTVADYLSSLTRRMLFPELKANLPMLFVRGIIIHVIVPEVKTHNRQINLDRFVNLGYMDSVSPDYLNGFLEEVVKGLNGLNELNELSEKLFVVYLAGTRILIQMQVYPS